MIRLQRLSDVCSLVTDGTHYTPPDVDSGVPFLTVKDIGHRGELDFEGCSKITADEFERAAAGNSAPQLGDVLFSKDGTVGKISVVRKQVRFAVLSSIAILRPNAKLVDANYLGHALRSPEILAQALKKKTGSAIRRIVLSDLKSIQVPLPPLAEQRRIAAILDKADTLRAKRREAIVKLDQLLQSVFLELFGDVSSNHQGWPEAALGDVVESTKLGLVRGASEFGDAPEFDVPYIRMDAIGRGGEFLQRKVRMTKATAQEIKESSVCYGDFLFNTRNSKDLVGKSTVFESRSSGWTFNNNLMRVRFSDRANSFYMLRYLMSRRGQAEMEKRKSGTTSVFAVYYKDLKTLPVVLPPKNLQDKFQCIVEDQRKVRERVAEQELRVQSLMQALQHAAFSDRL